MRYKHIHNCIVNQNLEFCIKHLINRICDQALDLLVSVSSTHYCAYTPDLSNSQSLSGLTNLCYGISYLEQYGKTEMWYVMDCEPGAYLYYGFSKEISKEEFAERIQNDTLLEVLHKVEVQKGDALFIEAGTIHAIGKDILIAEIQQNSNLTYRVYDYGRVGKDGKKRYLHIEKALAVTKRIPLIKSKKCNPHIADCDYFTVDKLNLDGQIMERMSGYIGPETFASILIMEGEGHICCKGEVLPFRKGDSFFLTAGSGSYDLSGQCEALVTTIRQEKRNDRV